MREPRERRHKRAAEGETGTTGLAYVNTSRKSMCLNVHMCVHNHINIACIAYADGNGHTHTRPQDTKRTRIHTFQMTGLLQGRICECSRYHVLCCVCVCVCFSSLVVLLTGRCCHVCTVDVCACLW